MDNDPISAASTIKSETITTKGMGSIIGDSGTTIMSGIISGEEYNNRLKGKFGIRMFDIMRRSEPSAHGALQVVKLPIITLEHRIEPASDDETDQYIARFVQDQLFNQINFANLKREGLTFLDFGFAVAEKTYGATEFEGQFRIGISDIGFRKQISIERWQTEDKKPGITQQLNATTDGKASTRSIPMQKLVVWSNEKEGNNYEGISLLRFAYKDFDMKDKLGLVHAVGLEKMAIPTPVLTPTPNPDDAELARAKASLQQYRSNEKAYIIKPAGWELDKFDMSGQSIRELLPALQYYDRQMFMSVLAAFLSLGASDASGSKAVGQVQYKPYIQQEEAINKTFMDALQEQLIKQLCDLNFTDLPNGYPKLVSSRVQDDDITALSTAVKSFQDAGMLTPDFETEQHVRKLIHFPDAPDELEEEYKLKREQAVELIKNPPKPTDPTLPVDPKNPPKKDPAAKPTKASALNAARIAQRQLIDVLVN